MRETNLSVKKQFLGRTVVSVRVERTELLIIAF